MSVMEPILMDNFFPIPKWLDQNFLEKSIRKHCKTDLVHIQNFSIVPATAKGDNFASVMFRVNVNYHFGDEIERKDTFIIKTCFEDSYELSLLNEMNVYEKELEMYQCILPKLRILLDNAGHRGELFAGTMYVSFSKKAIVFEDLSQKGYKMPVRSNGLDIEHSKILLKKLAKFHATCAVLNEHQPGVFKNFKNGMLNRETSSLDQFYLTSFDVLTQVVSKWIGYEEYAEKLRKLTPKLIENGRRAFDAKAHQFNTLIHGDIWINNTMYTYNDKNEPEKMMLVDFQYCCWASPTIDLHYFLNTSLQEELRLTYQEELLQFYHAELHRMLTSLSYKKHIPTLHEFHVQFLENSFYALTSSLLVQPIMLNENSKDADISALLVPGEKAIRFRNTVYSNPKVLNNIKQLLPIFDKKGLLD